LEKNGEKKIAGGHATSKPTAERRGGRKTFRGWGEEEMFTKSKMLKQGKIETLRKRKGTTVTEGTTGIWANCTKRLATMGKKRKEEGYLKKIKTEKKKDGKKGALGKVVARKGGEPRITDLIPKGGRKEKNFNQRRTGNGS